MRITNLHHSGFSVELEQTVLIFDYYQDPAQVLPAILKKENKSFILSRIGIPTTILR